MEERIEDVKLVNVSLFANCKCQEKPNGGGFNNGTESFVIIDPTLLMKAFGDETTL